ncbi:MAG: thiamine phosphate synthase [Pseudorhodoplanes sp.]
MKVDLRLYALVDPQRASRHALPDLAAQVAAGGATLVQLRDKLRDTRTMIVEARAIRAALAPYHVPLLINDRVDVALASGAEGVHVGWDDMDPRDARRLLGERAIIGLSIKTLEQAQAAPVEILDYVAIGGVFVTMSKNNPDPPIGLAGLRTIASAIRDRAPDMPIGAIAGIEQGNAADVIAAGADGVAVISALSFAPNPQNAARKLRTAVDAALEKRTSS